MLERRTAVLGKIESTYGVDPTPVASDGLLISNPEIQPDGDPIVRDNLDASLSNFSEVLGKRWVTISFDAELKGGGAVDTPPKIGPFLRACAMQQTINAGTSVVYAPESDPTGFESITIYAYKDGVLYEANGCRGTFVINANVNAIGKIRFTFRGKYVAVIDTAMVNPTGDTVVPVQVDSAGCTLAGYSPVATALSLDIGNDVQDREDFNIAGGLQEIMIVGRNVVGSINPEAVLEATHTFWARWTARTEMALVFGPIGSAAGNRWRIDCPKVQYSKIGLENRNGLVVYGTTLRANRSASTGNDEISLTFT